MCLMQYSNTENMEVTVIKEIVIVIGSQNHTKRPQYFSGDREEKGQEPLMCFCAKQEQVDLGSPVWAVSVGSTSQHISRCLASAVRQAMRAQ